MVDPWNTEITKGTASRTASRTSRRRRSESRRAGEELRQGRALTERKQMSDNVAEFARLAERYCEWAASAPGSASHDEETARELLPRLYMAAHRLPQGAAPESEQPGTSHSEYARVRSRFRHLSVGFYGDTFDPLVVPPEEPTVSDLADDLSDIYGELRCGLELFRAGAPDAAAWLWRTHFRDHWGAHVVGALRALHHSWAMSSRGY